MTMQADLQIDTQECFPEITEAEVDKLRDLLDIRYHGHYSGKRKSLQFRIIQELFHSDSSYNARSSRDLSLSEEWNTSNRSDKLPTARPVLLCLCGPIAAGKSFVLQWMRERRFLPWDGDHHAVLVDMDLIRERLPESETYKRECPEQYGERTQREAGTIAELLVHLALQRERSVILDSSLRNIPWQESYLSRLRHTMYPSLCMLLIHVTAREDVIRTRSRRRGERTKRVVPAAILDESIAQLRDFQSIGSLCAIADLSISVENSEVCRPSIKFPHGLAWNMMRDLYKISLFTSPTTEEQDPSFDAYNTSFYSAETISFQRLLSQPYTAPRCASPKDWAAVTSHSPHNTYPQRTPTSAQRARACSSHSERETVVDLHDTQLDSDVFTFSLTSSEGTLDLTKTALTELPHTVLPQTREKTHADKERHKETSSSTNKGLLLSSMSMYVSTVSDGSARSETENDDDEESVVTIVRSFVRSINDDMRCMSLSLSDPLVFSAPPVSSSSSSSSSSCKAIEAKRGAGFSPRRLSTTQSARCRVCQLDGVPRRRCPSECAACRPFPLF